jgi:hypothetical protein
VEIERGRSEEELVEGGSGWRLEGVGVKRSVLRELRRRVGIRMDT